MFFKNSEFYLEVELPDPYLSVYLVNYIQEGNGYHIIVSGHWKRKLKNCGYAKVNGQIYSAHEEKIDVLIPAFEKKYGNGHLEFHNMHSGTAYILEPNDQSIRTRYEILEAEFDDISENYENFVKRNPVEVYMRETTSNVLSQIVHDGVSILEIGCGTLIETSAIRANVYLTCAEISNEMIHLVQEKSNLIKQVNLETLKVSSGYLKTDKKYDIIFTTFGYLDLEDAETIETTLKENLKTGGIFIGAYWNRFGLMDIIMSTLLGRYKYVKQKIAGTVLPDLSRFTTATLPKSPLAFSSMEGFSEIKRLGLCTIIPPYNFNKIAKRLGRKGLLFAIDKAVSSLPIIKNFGDYIIVVLKRKNVS
ncbi:MAG: class I SAM-dependent methyltransferase [Candidatus Thermoplasmatota archaeon]|nr:class I SAM-dependent methyltransferase [Candidatus Thermoplasmatota archaeon]